jgi:hypothetical protein
LFSKYSFKYLSHLFDRQSIGFKIGFFIEAYSKLDALLVKKEQEIDT